MMNDKREQKIKIPLSIYLELFPDLWLHFQVREETVWNFVCKDKEKTEDRKKDEKTKLEKMIKEKNK
jgi:hypothetical protein